MGISNSQSTERSLNNLVFPILLDEIVCADILAYPHEQRICWSWVRKWTGKRFGERWAEFWHLHAGTGQRSSFPATVRSCRPTKMQFVIGWIGGRPRTVDWSFCIFGISCMSPVVSWMNSGALCIPKKISFSRFKLTGKPIAMPGFVRCFPRSDAWSCRLAWANVCKIAPIRS